MNVTQDAKCSGTFLQQLHDDIAADDGRRSAYICGHATLARRLKRTLFCRHVAVKEDVRGRVGSLGHLMVPGYGFRRRRLVGGEHDVTYNMRRRRGKGEEREGGRRG
jgi:hypothetical protein